MSDGLKMVICLVLVGAVPALSALVWLAHRKRLNVVTEKLGRPGAWRRKQP